MSYQVLARKWRPRNFSELVGQSHVMQALSNALDQQRLHHAYLFTGTRGVGKTTIARIFSKALNCEEGVSSQPCGKCAACRSIDEGRFIDLIEVDAASKTKVDDTREILDNVQFAPTQGRYKVYLIDEVHMLSKSSFNALLKTLEEPPEHVKFLLATTDPHKLPITVLSRCLQFNLMRLTQVQIQSHLQMILEQEQLPYEAAALGLIAHSADGSARDALSLLDQAIAYGGGQVAFEAVQTMLGLVDQQYSLELVRALAAQDIDSLKAQIQHFALMGVDYPALLAQLIEVMHSLASIQLYGELPVEGAFPLEVLRELADDLSPERVQLLYQIALLAKQDMMLAPDIRVGFEMAMIRMLAFQPGESSGAAASGAGSFGSGESTSKEKVSKAPGSPHSVQRDSSALQMNPHMDQRADQTVQLGEMSIEEAMAGLASARSLVGKSSAKENVLEEQPSHPESGEAMQSAASFASSADSAGSEQAAPAGVDHLAEVRARLQALGKPEAGSESGGSGASLKKVSETVSLESLNSAEISAPPMHLSERLEERMSEGAPLFDASVVSAQNHAEDVFAVPEGGADVEPQAQGQVELREAVVTLLENERPETMSQLSVEKAESVENVEDRHVLQWMDLIQALQLKGMAAEVAMNSVLVSYDQNGLVLSLDPTQDFSRQEGAFQQIASAVAEHFGAGFAFSWEQAATHFTPRAYQQRQKEIKMQLAKESILSDQAVRHLTGSFGWRLLEDTIAPLDISAE
ncbi:DNA polymerase III subunit gamma/tau [Thiomicrorhabdus sp.]|uniref:DNA polymerase III subunit gamma/tau n=1 Tax=Thiomicrorhabdus sp. TaxID=2039724 RepID=UPI0029C8AE65|nr:DNA polymerase III subunit gamma/tau [Thiomicrorhabdus sp.]